MDDLSSVTQLVLHERQGRDRGWWAQMLACFWPDATVKLSWIDASGTDFVRRSKEMSGRGDRSVHRLGPPTVHLQGDRALVELPAGVEFRVDWDGVPADLISYTRLNYRLERRADKWKIKALDAIYERDTLTPRLPGQLLTVEHLGDRDPYALVALYLTRRGYSVGDLLADDQPEKVEAFYADAFGWLGQNTHAPSD